jgi:hypothetical protein
MYSFLLKKALPFTLTFVFGAALGIVGGLFGPSGKKAEYAFVTRTYDYGGRCRMRSRRLVAESRPLNIIYTPDARRPPELKGTYRENIGSLRVSVTFGADGKVQGVKPTSDWFKADTWGITNSNGDVELLATLDAVKAAAQGIRFEPETVNSVPVTVTKDVEIRFMPD